MTPRGVLALGASAVAAGWALGARSLVLVGVGLLLTVLATRAWSRVVLRGSTVEQEVAPGPYVEGEPIVLSITVDTRFPVPADLRLEGPLGRAGPASVALRRRHASHVRLDGLPRGRFELGTGRLVATDLLGLARLEQAVEGAPTILVRPRVPRCTGLFSDRGGRVGDAAPTVTRRPTGLEPHGVREYRDGEPLRAVHWPSTARLGRLMIRELDDGAHADVCVVVDTDPRGVVGPEGSSTLDEAARVAAAVVRGHLVRGRRAVLIAPGGTPDSILVRGLDATWEDALDLLACMCPGRELTGRALLRAPRVGGALPHDVVVVTALAEHGRADALIAAAATGRRPALVAIDGPTYLGKPHERGSASLLRSTAAGVSVVRVAHGDDLGVRLGAAAPAAATREA